MRWICAFAALSMVACSTYDARWDAARIKKGIGFDGAYQGRWQSAQMRNAGGDLRCILTRISGDEYAANFHAKWHGIFASEHTVNLKVSSRKKDQSEYFSGEARIETWIGAGNYRCVGRLFFPENTAGKPRLQARYEASYDVGRFDLIKVDVRQGRIIRQRLDSRVIQE